MMKMRQSNLRLITLVLTILIVSLNQFCTKDVDSVYICKGPYSKRYHLDKKCTGLRNCSTDIYRVTLDEAKKMNRTLCGYED